MNRSQPLAALCAMVLLLGCVHGRGAPSGSAPSGAAGDGPAAESPTSSPAPPTAHPTCSIAPSVVGGVAKGMLVPLIVCLAGGPVTLLICGLVMEEAAGVAAGLIIGSMAFGGLIGAGTGASECRTQNAAALIPVPPPTPEPAPPAGSPPDPVP